LASKAASRKKTISRASKTSQKSGSGIAFWFSRLGGKLLAVGCVVDPAATSIEDLEQWRVSLAG
jgi:hypothetical protein